MKKRAVIYLVGQKETNGINPKLSYAKKNLDKQTKLYEKHDEVLDNQLTYLTYSLFGFSFFILKELTSSKGVYLPNLLIFACVFFSYSVLLHLNARYALIISSKTSRKLLNEANKKEENDSDLKLNTFDFKVPFIMDKKGLAFVFPFLFPFLVTLHELRGSNVSVNEYINKNKILEENESTYKELDKNIGEKIDNVIISSNLHSRAGLLLGFILISIFLYLNISNISKDVESKNMTNNSFNDTTKLTFKKLEKLEKAIYFLNTNNDSVDNLNNSFNPKTDSLNNEREKPTQRPK